MHQPRCKLVIQFIILSNTNNSRGKLNKLEAKRNFYFIFPAGSVVLWLLSRAGPPSHRKHGPYSETVEPLRSFEASGPAHRPHHLNPGRSHRQGDGTDIQLLPRLSESVCMFLGVSVVLGMMGCSASVLCIANHLTAFQYFITGC